MSPRGRRRAPAGRDRVHLVRDLPQPARERREPLFAKLHLREQLDDGLLGLPLQAPDLRPRAAAGGAAAGGGAAGVLDREGQDRREDEARDREPRDDVAPGEAAPLRVGGVRRRRQFACRSLRRCATLKVRGGARAIPRRTETAAAAAAAVDDSPPSAMLLVSTSWSPTT